MGGFSSGEVGEVPQPHGRVGAQAQLAKAAISGGNPVELRPELFLTIGSPLALPRAVFERLLPSPQGSAPALRGARPPGVTRWVNIADPGDPVAIPPGLGGFFDGVALDHTTVVGFHYLRSSTTAAILAPYLG
ncbi:hypothetical protein [Streptomyces sp. NPDC091299]|uniref:hypothetical protein n=1 Tax=Streptomyces sp. NPDC091299 TaxID=3155302 RepID=UPI00341709D0